MILFSATQTTSNKNSNTRTKSNSQNFTADNEPIGTSASKIIHYTGLQNPSQQAQKQAVTAAGSVDDSSSASATNVNVPPGTKASHKHGSKEAGSKPQDETGSEVTETALGNEITTQKTSSSSQTNKIFEESKMHKNRLQDQGNIFQRSRSRKKVIITIIFTNN